MTAALASLTLALLSAQRPVVLLSPEDRSHILGPVVQSVQAQLSDLPVELVLQPVPRLEGFLGAQMKVARQVAGPEGLAVVWLELSPGDPIFVYVADPQRNRVLARSVDWDGALSHLEPVGLIVRASIQALLAGQQIGFEAPAPPKGPPRDEPPPPLPPVRSEKGFRLGLSLGYAPTLVGGVAPLLHGLDASLSAGWGEHLFLTGGYRVIAPFLMRANPYALAYVSRHPLWFGAGGRARFGPLQLGGELACGVDLVNIDMKEVGPWVSVAPPHEQVVVSLAPTVFGAYRIVDPLSVYLSVGVDVPINERHYYTQGPGGRAVVVTPWEVQPRAAVGIRLDIL